MDLESWSQCLKVLADPTRVRLLAILEHEELTVAELASITGLALTFARPRLRPGMPRSPRGWTGSRREILRPALPRPSQRPPMPV